MPVLTVTGPRQSGKTTLCRTLFSNLPYVSLEAPDERAFARDDPRGFLTTYADGAILDEIQNVPELVSYLQVLVDEDPAPGRFVLTGSHHLAITGAVSQSLAGRTHVLHLLPLSRDEVVRFDDPPISLWESVFRGSYPRIHDRGLDARTWLRDYTATYIERDVRSITRVTDLDAFTLFCRLVAGSTAQELNLSRLGADAGVAHNTARAWLSILAASFITFRLPPLAKTLRKRLVKAPKIHMVDSGLACFLIGIESADQLVTHPLRGAIFESWVAAEIYKARVHAGLSTRLSHARLTRGAEVDVVLERGEEIVLVEAKSGATLAPSQARHVRSLAAELEEAGATHVAKRLVYGGDRDATRSGVELIGWASIQNASWGRLT